MSDEHENFNDLLNLGIVLSLSVTVAFIILKISGNIDWSWCWILSPILFFIIILISIFLFIILLGLIIIFIKSLITSKKKDKKSNEFVKFDIDISSKNKSTINNKPTGNKSMNKILKFAKTLTLTKKEKLLRENDLKDSNGEYTEEYKEIVFNKIFAEHEDYVLGLIEKKLAEEKVSKK